MMFLLPDPEAAVRAYHRLLAPGGRLAFSTYGSPDPRADEARNRLRRRAGLRADGPDVFDDPRGIALLLESAGFDDIVVAVVDAKVRFAGTDQWWAWAWSVGLRGSLERIPPGQLAAARADVEDALAGARKADGSLLLTTRTRVTTATAH